MERLHQPRLHSMPPAMPRRRTSAHGDLAGIGDFCERLHMGMKLSARVALILALVCLAGRSAPAEPTALDRYVAAPDPNYAFHVVSSQNNGEYKTHVIEMTSQSFLTKEEVDKPLWKHWLTVVVPDHVTTSTALLYINGGSSDRPAPQTADLAMVFGALTTHSVVADLHGIPNEPLVFAGDGRKRTEDAIIAYTWDKFLKTGDDRWPARLPMTKAVVRAMDTVQTFCQSDEGGKVKIDSFAVSGSSKRGWTTWSTAPWTSACCHCADRHRHPALGAEPRPAACRIWVVLASRQGLHGHQPPQVDRHAAVA